MKTNDKQPDNETAGIAGVAVAGTEYAYAPPLPPNSFRGGVAEFERYGAVPLAHSLEPARQIGYVSPSSVDIGVLDARLPSNAGMQQDDFGDDLDTYEYFDDLDSTAVCD